MNLFRIAHILSFISLSLTKDGIAFAAEDYVEKIEVKPCIEELDSTKCRLLIKVLQTNGQPFSKFLECAFEEDIKRFHNMPPWLKERFEKGDINSNRDDLFLTNVLVTDELIFFLLNSDGYIESTNKGTLFQKNVRTVLAIRTETQFGSPGKGERDFSNEIFGTYGDNFTMKSQYEECSYGKMKVSAASNSEFTHPGVLSVNVIAEKSSSYDVAKKAIEMAAKTLKLDDWTIQTNKAPYDHGM
jgi:hypothetical protein